MSQCTETTAAGERCKNATYGPLDRCYVHAVGVSPAAGRPIKLTSEVADRLVATLRSGNYLHVAVKAAGIHRDTFLEWMKRGATGESPFAELRERVEQSRAEGQVRNIALIARAAEEDWRAAAWLAERSYPELWGGVSVRVRAEAEPPPQDVEALTEDDPFTEFDELAERRRRRA